MGTPGFEPGSGGFFRVSINHRLSTHRSITGATHLLVSFETSSQDVPILARLSGLYYIPFTHRLPTDVKWFAGLAMQAMIAKQGIPESQSAREEIALWAFRMGQAMVATEDSLHASD